MNREGRPDEGAGTPRLPADLDRVNVLKRGEDGPEVLGVAVQMDQSAVRQKEHPPLRVFAGVRVTDQVESRVDALALQEINGAEATPCEVQALLRPILKLRDIIPDAQATFCPAGCSAHAFPCVLMYS